LISTALLCTINSSNPGSDFACDSRSGPAGLDRLQWNSRQAGEEPGNATWWQHVVRLTGSHMARIFASILFACLFAVTACSGDKPKDMLETAEFEERQMNMPHAKQLYEDLIRLYPSSEEAEKARARLSAITPAH